MLRHLLLFLLFSFYALANIPPQVTYDANDNRIAKTTSHGTTTYLVDANTPFAQVITESKSDGTEIKYTYGNDLLSDGEHSFLTDALGSTRGLADSTGALTDSYVYTPYGELANHDGISENSFLFTGEQLDKETDEYYLRARYYSPSMSRFVGRDSYDGTANSPITQNHYLYGNGNPLTYVDPSGHMSLMELNMVSNIMGGIGRISMSFGRVGGIISNAEVLVTSYNSVSALTRASQLFANTSFNVMGDPEFKKAMENYQEGINTLIANTGAIVMRLARGKARKHILRSFINKRTSKFVIYGPTPLRGNWFPVGTKINLGSINVGRSSRKIILELGRKSSTGGRFIGVGNTQGGGVGSDQWFRMDWHSLVGHSDSSRDWRSGNYHFHIGKALK